MSISLNMKGSFSRGQQPKDGPWSDLAEAFTAAALNNIAGNNGNAAIKPVTIPATSVKFDKVGTYTVTCTDAIQVNWNALNTSGAAGSGLQTPNIGTVEYPMTGALTQAEINAQIQAFQDGITNDKDWKASPPNVTGVFVTGDGTGHEDIIGMNGSTPVCAFHNKNNAFSKGDGRDFGLSGAAHSALAALMPSTQKQNMINNYFAFLLRQFKTIVKGKGTPGSSGATTSGTIGNLGLKQEGGIPRITATQFKTDFDNIPAFRRDLEACIQSRTTAVPSWRVVSTYQKTGYGVPSVVCKMYTFVAGSIVNGTCTQKGNNIQILNSKGKKVCKITVRSDDNRIAQVLMQGHAPIGSILGENRMNSRLRNVLRKALHEIIIQESLSPEAMADLEEFAQEPSQYPGLENLPDAENDEFNEAIFDTQIELADELQESYFSDENTINESRWLKLAGILKD